MAQDAFRKLNDALTGHNCAARAVGAGLTGVGLGVGAGAFIGTFIGAHGEIVGNTLLEQLKNGFKNCAAVMWDRSKFWSKNFALVGVTFAGTHCYVEQYRKKHDYWNDMIAGGLTGGLLALQTRSWRAVAVGAAGFAAFGTLLQVAMDKWMESAKFNSDFYQLQQQQQAAEQQRGQRQPPQPQQHVGQQVQQNVVKPFFPHQNFPLPPAPTPSSSSPPQQSPAS